MRVAGMFLALALVSGLGVYGMQAAVAGAGQLDDIDGESFTPNAGQVQQLDRSNVANAYYNDTVTVVDENGDRSYEGTDYEWFERNGTIKPLVGGNLDGDASATIDYGYRQTTEEQRQLVTLASQIPRSAALVLPLGFVLAAIVSLRGV